MEGVWLAPSDAALEPNPAWVRIDQTYNVQQWTVDRGRQNEMSRTSTGTARVELVDKFGDFDPTNTGGAFYGLLYTGVPMGPLVQAMIGLQNPCSPTDSGTIFRGFISSIAWTPYQTQEWANVTLELVDGLALLAAAEMPFDGTVGDDFLDGNIVFDEDLNLNAVQTRIGKLLDAAGWPVELRSIFTGNVALQRTVYPPRTPILSAMQDAADAEFPDVSNIYIGGPRHPGEVVFHGRFARFHPGDGSYGLLTWLLGDDAAAGRVRVSPPLVASLDDTLLYTSALATPANVNDKDIPGQYVENTPAKNRIGLRTWSAENLVTARGAPPPAGGANTTALQETLLYADYVRDNYYRPRVRVGQLTVKTRRPDSDDGPAVWQFFTQVDISDQVLLSTTHPAGGGFANEPFYVEGIHYTVTPGPAAIKGDTGATLFPAYPIVEVVLHVSPAGYYDSNPFEA